MTARKRWRRRWVTRHRSSGWDWPRERERLQKTNTGLLYKMGRALQMALFGTNPGVRRKSYRVGRRRK